jgi:hypothetical protein
MDMGFIDHLFRNGANQFRRRACGSRHLAGMQGHMSALDAFGRKGAQGAQVLRQTDRDDHFSQFAGGGNN